MRVLGVMPWLKGQNGPMPMLFGHFLSLPKFQDFRSLEFVVPRTYWGSRADAACSSGAEGGLQPQGMLGSRTFATLSVVKS